MADVTVKNTTAYNIIRIVTDNMWGGDEPISGSDCVSICKIFRLNNGSWFHLMSGNIDHVIMLEKSIEKFIKHRNTSKIASNIMKIYSYGMVVK